MKNKKAFLIISLISLFGFILSFNCLIFAGRMFDSFVIVLVSVSKWCFFISLLSLVFYKFTKLLSCFRRIFSVFLVIVIISSAFLLKDIYENSENFFQSSNSSILIGKYDAATETQDLLPFYDEFYQANPNDAEYAVLMSKNNLCTEITTSNNYRFILNSPSHTTSFTRCTSFGLLFKARVDLIKLLNSQYFVVYDTKKILDIDLQIYNNGDNYLVTIKDGFNTYMSEFLCLSDMHINIDDYIVESVKQYLLCCDLSNNYQLPIPDHIYQENT